MRQIERYEAYCFDLDGTIYLDNQVLPGAVETIATLRKLHKKVLFISNTPTQTRMDCVRRLTEFGIEVEEQEVITAGYMTALYFKEHYPESMTFVVGEEAIRQEFGNLELPITLNPFEATHVVVGLDREFSYEKLNKAMQAVRNGAKLIVTNLDSVCPVPGGFIADTMAIAKAIETASDEAIYTIIGKPSHYYARKMLQFVETPATNCLIIGDRIETDILLGKHANIPTCLVLTGVSNREHIEKTCVKPDYVIERLDHLMVPTSGVKKTI